MPDHKRVADTGRVEIQIPSEVFLARLFISPHSLFAKFPDQPLRQIIAKTAGINEIVLGLVMLNAVLSNVTTVLISEFIVFEGFYIAGCG